MSSYPSFVGLFVLVFVSGVTLADLLAGYPCLARHAASNYSSNTPSTPRLDPESVCRVKQEAKHHPAIQLAVGQDVGLGSDVHRSGSRLSS